MSQSGEEEEARDVEEESEVDGSEANAEGGVGTEQECRKFVGKCEVEELHWQSRGLGEHTVEVYTLKGPEKMALCW